MAEGRVEPSTAPVRRDYQWTEIFKSFQVALDPRKLLAAAAGILVMSLGWYFLSTAFYYAEPVRNSDAYSNKTMEKKKDKPKADLKPEEIEKHYRDLADADYARDYKQWETLHSLAGRGGKLRTMPWDEYRGENPFLFATKLADAPSAAWGESVRGYLLSQIPVLVEPLYKLFLIVTKIIDPDASTQTRLYLLLCLLWSVAVWAFFGGIITRIAAVQFGGKERISLRQAVRFVANRYLSYLLSPLVPLAIVAVIVFFMSIYGALALIPILGDILLYGLGFPLVILGGIVMAVLLIGLVGYPMMYTTISTEGSDTFDALSRSYNYVFQAPWQYLWYGLVAIVYGAAVTFVVIVVGCLMVYLGKGAVSQPASALAPSRKPDFLFLYSPKSLGWQELLLKGSPAEVRPEIVEDEKTKHPRRDYVPVIPAADRAYRDDLTWWNEAGAGMVTFWMVLIFLLMIGFSYSYFWSASTMIYLLMRKKVDEVELDEVYIEEQPAPALAPPPAPPASTGPAGSVPLPTVPPPAPANMPSPPSAYVPPSVPPAAPSAVTPVSLSDLAPMPPVLPAPALSPADEAGEPPTIQPPPVPTPTVVPPERPDPPIM